MVYEFDGFRPVVDQSSFIHPQAAVIGNVTIGKDVYIGPGAALRGDWGEIVIMDGCNVQENCVIHMFPGVTVILEEGAHIGHGAVIHGAHIQKNCLVGMNAVVMDKVLLGEGSIVGALAFVKEGMKVPPHSLLVGNPAKIVKKVSKDMLKWKSAGTLLYQQLPSQAQATMKPCSPLRKPVKDKPKQMQLLKNWSDIQSDI